MITGDLRNKVDRIWETFWTGGITNPLDVIDVMKPIYNFKASE